MMSEQQHADAGDEAMKAARAGVERLTEVCDAVRHVVSTPAAWEDFAAKARSVLDQLDRLLEAYRAGEVNHATLVFTSRRVAFEAERAADEAWLKHFDLEEN